MTFVTMTVAPGIWRDPHWILDEFERVATKHKTATLVDAILIVCKANHWRCTFTRAADRAGEEAMLLSLFPLQPRPMIVDGHVDVDLPLFRAAPANGSKTPCA